MQVEAADSPRSALRRGHAARHARLHRLQQLGESFAVGIVLNRDGRRRILMRKALFDIAGRVSPFIFTSEGGISYFLDTHDRVVSRVTFAAGAYDDEVMSRAMSLLDDLGRPLRGRTFVDVGANLGTSTIPALLRFGARRVIAVEPEPRNFRLLRHNLIANDVEDRVVAVCAAASDQSGAGRLQLSSWNSGDHRVQPKNIDVTAEAAVTQPVVEIVLERLDDILDLHVSGHAEVGLVWIDCQGHEGYVLKGAPALAASDVPIVCEYWPYGLRRTDNLELFHRLVAENYRWVVNIGDLRGQEPAWIEAQHVADLEHAYPEQSFTDLILLKNRSPRR